MTTPLADQAAVLGIDLDEVVARLRARAVAAPPPAADRAGSTTTDAPGTTGGAAAGAR